jgi:hypothetical protein
MRLLKLLLSTILLICIFWGLLILAGPKLIDIAVQTKLGGAVKLSGIKVSPKLTVSASRIDISELDVAGITISKGSLRAAELSWGEFFSGRPVIHVTAAYAKFDGDLELDYFSIDLRPKSKFTFNEYSAQLKLENLSVEDVLFVGQATAEADLEVEDLVIKNLYFNFQDFETEENLKVTSDLVVGTLSEWQVVNMLAYQDALLDMRLDNLEISLNSEIFEVNKLGVEGSLGSNGLEVDFKGVSGKFAGGIGVNEFNVKSITRDLSNALDLVDLKFSVSDLILPSSDPNEANKEINFLSGFVARNPESLGKIYLQGTLGDFELFFQRQVLANISQATIKVEGSLVDANQVYSKVSVVKKDFIPATLVSELKFNHEFDNLIDCAFSKCVPEKLNATYEVNLDGNRLIGALECELLHCLGNPYIHTVKTIDTQKFFQSLVKTNILNPIISMGFYNVILSGEKTGDGNIIDF